MELRPPFAALVLAEPIAAAKQSAAIQHQDAKPRGMKFQGDTAFLSAAYIHNPMGKTPEELQDASHVVGRSLVRVQISRRAIHAARGKEQHWVIEG